MEFRQLQYAVLLARTLHFGQAAERAFISQSAFSQQIARLERELDVRIFDRSSNRVAVTAAGELFIERARRMLDDWVRITTEVQDLDQRASGSLRVGVFADNAGELTHLVLDNYRRRCPDVGLSFVGLNMSNQIEAVRNGEVDLAFLRLPLADPDLEIRPLFAEPRMAILPFDHLLASRDSVRIDDVVEEPFVTAVSSVPETWGEYWRCDSARGGPGRVIAEMNSVTESLHAVAYLRAVDTCPAATARHHPHPGVAYVPIEDGGYSEVALVHRRMDNRAQIRAFAALSDEAVHSWLSAVPGAVPSRRGLSVA